MIAVELLFKSKRFSICCELKPPYEYEGFNKKLSIIFWYGHAYFCAFAFSTMYV